MANNEGTGGRPARDGVPFQWDRVVTGWIGRCRERMYGTRDPDDARRRRGRGHRAERLDCGDRGRPRRPGQGGACAPALGASCGRRTGVGGSRSDRDGACAAWSRKCGQASSGNRGAFGCDDSGARPARQSGPQWISGGAGRGPGGASERRALGLLNKSGDSWQLQGGRTIGTRFAESVGGPDGLRVPSAWGAIPSRSERIETWTGLRS